MSWTTIPANALTVYSSGYGAKPPDGANPEDLLDLITNIDPWDNIVFAMMPKRKASSTSHYWLYTGLPTVGRAGVIDGADFDGQAGITPIRSVNYTQIFRYDLVVSGTQQALNPMGIGNTLNYNILQATHGMAKAAEQRIFDVPNAPGNPGAGTLASAGNARLASSLYDLMGVSSSMYVDAALAAITTTMVDTAMELSFSAGNTPEYLVLSPGVKADFTASVVSTTVGGTGGSIGLLRNINAVDKRVIKSIDVYEGDFGALSILPNRSIAQVTASNQDYGWAWLLQRDMLGVAFLRPITSTPLARTGDSFKTMILGEFTFELMHPKGAAAIKRVIT